MKRTLLTLAFLLGGGIASLLHAQTLVLTRTAAGEGPAQKTISVGETLFVELPGDDKRYAGELIRLEESSLTLVKGEVETTYAFSDLSNIGIKKGWLTALRGVAIPGIALGTYLTIAGPVSYFTSTSSFRGLDLILIPIGLAIGGISSIPFWLKRPQFPADSFQYAVQ
ncbi:MAG TPA: hypothetical protein DCE41_12160 [Cytophagales bacterium]|nr:hypothetical protein [Cytophagales bacterium]HAA21730.1 hypothetical protein [Cytophagales bacterium]HAP62212.1 hypothetical protein [Cytophagales bacterium]